MPWWRRAADLNILFTLTLGVLLLAFLHTKRLEKAFASWGAAVGLAVLAVLFYCSHINDVALALGIAAALLLVSHCLPRLRRAAGQAARFALFGFLLFWLLRRNIPLPGGGSIHFSFDYGIYALVLFAALYWAKTPWRQAGVIALWGLWCYSGDWAAVFFVLMSALCAVFYNGEKGRDDHRLFYWAYPAHLFLLWGLLALLRA